MRRFSDCALSPVAAFYIQNDSCLNSFVIENGLISFQRLRWDELIALVAGHLLKAAQQVQLEGVGAGSVIHLHQFAYLVMLVGDLLCPIVVDFLRQIKGSVGILGHIAIRVGLGDHVSIPIVGIDSAVTQGINFAGTLIFHR